ncbi:MAG: hypothetical protein RL139_134 [Gemmatimonadota bacterium]
MPLHRRLGGGPLLLAVCALAVACTSTASDQGTPLVVDDFGDTVRLAAPATRIVSLNPVTTEVLIAIGARERLVGRTHWDLGAAEVPDVGDGMQPNVEAILAQRPDLVVLYESPANRGAVERLRAAGITTIAFRTDRVADLARVAPVLGAAVGDRPAGITVAAAVRATIDSVAALPRRERPVRAFWHIWDAPLLTIGRGSYLTELLEAAGGRSLFDDLAAPSPQVTLEEIVRRDPDVILAGPAGAEAIRRHPGWAAVRAVREGRVLVVDTALVGRPGVRMGEAAAHLRRLLDDVRVP